MNAGLVWLLRTGPRAWVRSLGRKARGGKRIALVVGGAAVLALLLLSQIPAWRMDSARPPEELARQHETVRLLAPLVLTAFLLLIDLSGRGLYFKPQEIDFLFPAPIPRRDLLVYQVAARAGVAALSGLWTAIFVARYAGTLLGGLVAPVLTIVFLQMASQLGSLALASLGARTGPRVRIAFWAVVAVLGALGLRSAMASVPPGAPAREALAAFSQSPFVVVATAPVQPFARLFSATGAGEALLWTLACAAEMALVLVLMLRLDVAYEEAALATSRRVQERLRRMRSGEGAFLPATRSAQRRRVPRLPRLGGAGPVAHRQLLEIVRNPTSVLWTAASVLFCSVLIVVIGAREGGDKFRAASVAALGAAVGLTTFVSQGFTFDFRRDLDRMAEWKGLPLRPVTLAAGQLVAPTLVFTLLQAAAAAIAVVAGGLPAWALAAALVALPPWNWIAAALDNALFLFLPYRIAPEDTAKVPFVGKMFLTMLLKTVAIGFVAVLAAVPLATGIHLGGGAAFAGIVTAWVVLVGAAAASTWLVATSFRAFDVSRDV